MVKGSGYAEGRHGKGRLFKRGRVWWVQYYANGQQVRETSGSDKKAVAEKLLMRRLVESESGEITTRQKPLTYEALREKYITTRLLDNPKLTRRDLEYATRRLDDFFAGTSSSTITESKIDEFKLARKADGVSNATVNGALRVLNRMFVLSRKLLKSTPEITLLPDPPPRKGFLNRDRYHHLDSQLPAYLRPIVAFAYNTGMRQGELDGLRWPNVNRAEGMIRLEVDETKNEESREIPYGKIPELARLMDSLAQTRKSDLVFTRPDGKPLGCYRKAWNRACIKAGLGRMCWKCKKCHTLTEVVKQPWPPDVAPKDAPACSCGTVCHWHYEGLMFHDLRRSAVRNLRRAGVPESIAMKISGHKTREVFERYNIKDQRDITEAMEKLADHQEVEDRKQAQPDTTRPN